MTKDSTKTTQFRITGYPTERDFMQGRGRVFTDMEDLLRFLDRRRYYNAENGQEVSCNDDFHYSYNESLDGYGEGRIARWRIDEMLAYQQRADRCVFEDLNDRGLDGVSPDRMRYYPYTMGEFLKTLANPPRVRVWSREVEQGIPLDEYDFVALLHS